MKILLLCLLGCGVSLGSKWSYDGNSGPLYWHELFPHACSGGLQSPIDIDPERTLYEPSLKDFAIWYDPPKPDSKMYIKNNGHTVQVDLEGDFHVTNGGLQHMYKAAQFHFHWGHKVHVGSEHTLGGKPSPIEMHVVTYNQELYAGLGDAATEKGGLAVLGVMFEVSKEDNPAFKDIITSLKHVRDPESKTRIALPLMSLRSLLPGDISRYYRYNGSLTTPGCFESVTWTVFDHKQTLSHRQLKEFRKLLQPRRHHNAHSVHRRSLSGAARRQENHAKVVLEELGIAGDSFLEAEFQGKLLMDRMYADMPVGGNTDATVHAKSEPEIPTKTMDTPTVTSHAMAEAEPEPMVVEKPVMVEYIQEVLVNNFRPVQPLNGRLVFRSFKLATPPVDISASNSASNAAPDCPQPQYNVHQSSKSTSNSGVAAAASLAATVCALVTAVMARL